MVDDQCSLLKKQKRYLGAGLLVNVVGVELNQDLQGSRVGQTSLFDDGQHLKLKIFNLECSSVPLH